MKKTYIMLLQRMIVFDFKDKLYLFAYSELALAIYR